MMILVSTDLPRVSALRRQQASPSALCAPVRAQGQPAGGASGSAEGKCDRDAFDDGGGAYATAVSQCECE
jgi:hypothetical protein